MSEDENYGCLIEMVFIVFAIGLLLGFLAGNQTADTKTIQKLCKEFTRTPYEYIDCNTKDIEFVIKKIKEN